MIMTVNGKQIRESYSCWGWPTFCFPQERAYSLLLGEATPYGVSHQG
jgi:hypothetical protein